MEQGRCSLTPRTQRRSQNIVLTLQRYEIIWLLPNILVLFLFRTLNRGKSGENLTTFFLQILWRSTNYLYSFNYL